MTICLDFIENCDQPTGILISYTVIYYAFVTAVILTQLITTRHLLKRLPNNDELLVFKALTFASFQVICFNIAGLWEARDDVHIMFRVIILVFQLLSILLLNVLMIIAFYEVKKSRKYEEVERDDEDDFNRVDLSEFDFVKTKFIFIFFGMIYSAVFVIGFALICELYANDPSAVFRSVDIKSYKVTESILEVKGRRHIKCGYIDNKCFAPDENGSCKTLPFCPPGMKRIFTGNNCCCVLKDAYKVVPSIVQTEKVKIITETLDSIDDCYDKVKNILKHRKKHSTSNESDKNVRIESLGRKVSDMMREGIFRLAKLVDVEFETLLKMIFDDEKIHENDIIVLVLKDAGDIYDRGNEVLEKIAKLK